MARLLRMTPSTCYDRAAGLLSSCLSECHGALKALILVFVHSGRLPAGCIYYCVEINLTSRGRLRKPWYEIWKVRDAIGKDTPLRDDLQVIPDSIASSCKRRICIRPKRASVKGICSHDQQRALRRLQHVHVTHTPQLSFSSLENRANAPMTADKAAQRHFKLFAELCKGPSCRSLSLFVIGLLLSFFVPRCIFDVALQPRQRTVCRGYKSSSSGLQHVHVSWSNVPPTHLHACFGVPQPIFKNLLTSTRGTLF